MPTVELFGVARVKAGVASVQVDGVTLGQVLRAAESRCAPLRGLLLAEGRIRAAYRVSLNAARFLSDLNEPIDSGDVLLVIAADPGG